jgi:cyanate permease
VALVAFSLGAGFLPIGPIAPLLIAHYNINNATAGFLTSIYFLVHIPLAIPASLVVNRIGLKASITLGALLGSVSLLSFLAIDSFALLLATRAISSLGFILMFPATGPLFMQWFPSKEIPLINGALVLAASLGVAFTNFLIAPLSNIFGWEVALSGVGGLALLSAITWIFFGPSSRAPIVPTNLPSIQRFREILTSRNTLLIAAADACASGLLIVSLAWLPTLYHQVHGISLAETGVLMGTMSVSGSIGLVLATLLTAATRKRRPFIITAGSVIGFAGLAAILVGNLTALYVIVAVLGVMCWLYLPALLTIPMELYRNDPDRVTMVLGVLLTSSSVIGAFAPAVAGAIADLTGSLIPGILIFVVVSWGLAIAGILLPETGIKRA